MSAGTSYRAELARKGIHLSSALVPLAYFLLSYHAMLIGLSICVGIMLTLEALRAFLPHGTEWFRTWFGYMLRDFESKRFTGATYVLLAGLLSVALFSREIAITVLFILSVSDSLASLVGRAVPILKIGDKSLGGSLAFALSALAIELLMHQPLPAAVAAALAGTVVEAASLKLGDWLVDDNLSVPLAMGVVLTWMQTIAPTL